MQDLDALIEATPERTPDKAVTEDAKIFLGGEIVTIRFTELDSRVWAACTMSKPPRPEVELDKMFGYNVTLATEAAAPLSSVQVDGDETAPISADRWVKIFARVDSQGRQSITDAVFSVNESAHLKRVAASQNLFEAASKRKRRSPVK